MKKIFIGVALATYSTAFSLEPPCTLIPNSEGVYEVANYEQLKVVPHCPLDGTYRLMADIDASASATQNCVDEGECEGFTPIGDYYKPFTGLFDGNGHVISGLWIQKSSSIAVGFIGKNEGNIQSLGLENGSVQGDQWVGLLVGYNKGGIDQCYATGVVVGYARVGGLLGDNRGVVKNSYAKTELRPVNSNSFDFGGLVGWNGGILTQNYAEGTFIDIENNTGGLVAANGLKEGRLGALGVMSGNYWNAELNDATGSNVDASGSSTSPISAEQATGLSAIEMYQKASYADWDFENTWVLYEGQTSPLLRVFMVPLTVSVESVEKVYDALPIASPIVTFSPIPEKPELLLGTPEFSVGSTVDVGSYELYVSGGLYSTQLGYAFSFDKTATLTITPAPLTVTAHDHNKVYGESDPVLSYIATGLLEGDVLTGTLSREPGESVGAYDITLGTLGNSNYDLTFTGSTLDIEPALLTVTANPLKKTYGEWDPELSYTTTGLVEDDPLQVLLKREVGEDVGLYAITAENIEATTNYTVEFVGSSLGIEPAPLTVIANSLTKTYGESDPVLSYIATGLLEGDVLTGTLSREPGESVGAYDITLGTLGNSNYDLTFTGSSLDIEPAPLSITVLNDTLEWGEAPGPFRFVFNGFVAGEDSTVLSQLAVTHDPVVQQGDYQLHLQALASNYSLTLVDGMLTIKAPVSNFVNPRVVAGRVQMMDQGVMVAGYRGPLHIYSLQGKRMASLNITHDGFYAIDLAPGHYRVR